MIPGFTQFGRDPVPGDGRGDRADETGDGVLREGVDGIAREGHQARDRRRGDDRATASFGHRPYGGACTEDDAVHVHAHDPAVLVVGERFEVRLIRDDTGVQEGDVDPSERRRGNA